MLARTQSIMVFLALLCVLGLAAYLRLVNLTDNPGWYSDEGTHVEIARNLLHGHLDYMALGQSTLMVSRLIGFEAVTAAAFALFGSGIATLRAVTGLLGVLSVLVLYLCVRRITGKPLLAVLSALLLAMYPQAVLYSRFGFSYNLLPLLLLLVYLGLWEYMDNGRRMWLCLAALAFGLGTISDLWMLAMVIPLAFVVIRKRWRDTLWSLPLAAAPFGVYMLMLWLHAPQALQTDLPFVLFRTSNGSLWGQVQNIAQNYTVLLSQDFWMPCAVIGFLLLRPVQLRSLTLLVFLSALLIIGRTVALYSLSAHYMIPLLPFVAFGAAALLYYGVPYMWQTMSASNVLRAGVCLLVVGTPFLVTLQLDMYHVQTVIPTAIDQFLMRPAEARQVAEYLNARVKPTDLVIVTPAMSWLIQARTADIQMSVAATGQGTVHYPPNIPPERWLYSPAVEGARYVVLDSFWRTWGVVSIPGLDSLIAQIQRWPQVFQAGSLSVYQNPAFGNS